MAGDWQTRAGWQIDNPAECEPELLINYAKFRRYIDEKQITGLNATEEELIMNICKDYNLKPAEVLDMKISEVMIYAKIKEKESFEQWYSFNNSSGSD